MRKGAKAKKGKKKKKAHTSTLRELKYTMTVKDDFSLEVNSANLKAFLISMLRELDNLRPLTGVRSMC